MDLLIATRNRHKTREFAELLGADFQVTDLTTCKTIAPVEESGETFAENADLKALTASRFFPNDLVLADDSGLIVDALGGAPGIFSARYAGIKASDADNIERLLRELRNTPKEDRTARFVCVLTLAKAAQVVERFVGETEGRIAEQPSGTTGFGYDPVFVPRGSDLTFAQLSHEQKNQISHRARAAEFLKRFLESATC